MPWSPGYGEAVPGVPLLTPAYLTIDLPLRVHHRLPEQAFAFGYRHRCGIVALCDTQAVSLRPMNWRSERHCLELRLKLLFAGIEEGGEGFLVAEDVVLYSYIGPALAVEADPPPVRTQSVSVDERDRRWITGCMTIGAWSCTVTLRARLRVEWPGDDAASVALPSRLA